MAFNPNVNALTLGNVTLPAAVSTVQDVFSLLRVPVGVIVALIDGPPFGPPVGFHVSVYLIVVFQFVKL